MPRTYLMSNVHECWEPLAKGEGQECICAIEGCHTILTVLNADGNCLEICQSNSNSLVSVIARIVLPDNLALCRIVDINASYDSVELHGNSS